MTIIRQFPRAIPITLALLVLTAGIVHAETDPPTYRIVDLGTNVSPGKVLAAVEEHRPKLIGLSALMTTTLPAMEATIGQIRKAGHDTPIVIGGAVVTEEYARQIGANAYAANAMEGVRVVKELLGTGRN